MFPHSFPLTVPHHPCNLAVPMVAAPVLIGVTPPIVP